MSLHDGIDDSKKIEKPEELLWWQAALGIIAVIFMGYGAWSAGNAVFEYFHPPKEYGGLVTSDELDADLQMRRLGSRIETLENIVREEKCKKAGGFVRYEFIVSAFEWRETRIVDSCIVGTKEYKRDGDLGWSRNETEKL